MPTVQKNTKNPNPIRTQSEPDPNPIRTRSKPNQTQNGIQGIYLGLEVAAGGATPGVAPVMAWILIDDLV